MSVYPPQEKLCLLLISATNFKHNKLMKPDSKQAVFCKSQGAKKLPTYSAVYAKRYVRRELKCQISKSLVFYYLLPH